MSAGLWTAGDFIAGAGPYAYSGVTGNENGLAFWFQGSVGIEESVALEEVQVYPNPAVSEVNIDLSGIAEVTTVEIVAVNGQVVLTGRLTPNSLSQVQLPDMESGVYFVSLQNEVTTARKKLVVR